MKNIREKLCAFFLLCIFSLAGKAQGCSDAGVCTVGSLNIIQYKVRLLPVDKNTLSLVSDEDDNIVVNPKTGKRDTLKNILSKGEGAEKNKGQTAVSDSVSKTQSTSDILFKKALLYPKYFFQFISSYGLGDRSVSVLTLQAEANIRIKKSFFAQIKLPYTFVSGELANISGPGDITASLSFTGYNRGKKSLSFTGGIKIPTGRADLSNRGLPLPMVYQTSLGSIDALGGVKFVYSKWDFILAYQHSFTETKNQYLRLPSLNSSVYNNYFESNKFKRSDDGVFRVNRNIKMKHSVIAPGLLFIYHLANDMITDTIGNRVRVVGSKGLTLNLNLAASVPVSRKLNLLFIAAAPVVTRKARPDGLTRHFVLVAGIKYNIY